jgi:hypothetical protein
MMDLLLSDGGAALTCSQCDRTWQVASREPFVPQLRALLEDHACALPAVTSLADWRSDRAPSASVDPGDASRPQPSHESQ